MEVIISVIFFIFGVVFGSFYNVVGIRLSLGQSIVKPGSHCMKCNHKLSKKDLIPVISFVFLKGKCRYCNQKLSLFYPVIELLTGILFMISYLRFGISHDMVLAILISSLFSIVLVSDINYYIIPDEVNLTFGVLIFIVNIFRLGFASSLIYVLYGIAIFIFMYLIMLLGNFLFKEESLGGGDLKLMFVLGMIFPGFVSILSFTLAAFIALPVSIIILLVKKNKHIPFGPFLVGAYLIMYFSGVYTTFLHNLI